MFSRIMKSCVKIPNTKRCFSTKPFFTDEKKKKLVTFGKYYLGYVVVNGFLIATFCAGPEGKDKSTKDMVERKLDAFCHGCFMAAIAPFLPPLFIYCGWYYNVSCYTSDVMQDETLMDAEAIKMSFTKFADKSNEEKD